MKRLYNGVVRTDRPSYRNVARIDHGVIPMLSEMMQNGMRVDVGMLRTIGEELEVRQEEMFEEMETIAGCKLDINLRSGDQLAVLLYEVLDVDVSGIKMTKKKTRLRTDKKTLSTIKERHAIIASYLKWKECATLRSNFVEKLPGMLAGDGRIHPQILLTRTATGRLASSNPNLQNIPTRSEDWGKKIRSAFIPADGYVIYSIDQSQIELRVIADNAGCKGLIDDFWTGIDIHTRTASRVFRIPESEVHPKRHRAPAKNINFGIAYGITAQGLLDQFLQSGAQDWTLEQCEQVIADYLDTYEEIRTFMDLQHRRARAYQCVWSMFGRVRFTPEILSTDRSTQEKCLREAGNMPIQAGAQELMKLCMAELHDIAGNIYSDVDRPRPLMQIHDELLYECKPEIVEEWDGICTAVFSACAELSVPLGSGSAWGGSWGELK